MRWSNGNAREVNQHVRNNVGPANPAEVENRAWKGVVTVNESQVPSTATSTRDTERVEGGPASLGAATPRPEAAAGPSGWTGGRITALVIGSLLLLISFGLLGIGGVAVWANTQRDEAGYVTPDSHEFSSSGSALVTERIHLGSPGVEWLYSPVLFDKVRIRVTPVSSDSELFVAIGPSADVDGYLAGVRHTVISDYWGESVQAIGGGTPGSAPGTQEFWVASATGPGAQTLFWEPTNGSWTVVVMNGDGRPGIDMVAELAAILPALPWIAAAFLAAGGVFAVGGALLVGGAIRRASRTRTV